eukprot:scaffold6358_cov267-Pinguiococcus_pyrenoidosus.AAC.2
MMRSTTRTTELGIQRKIVTHSMGDAEEKDRQTRARPSIALQLFIVFLVKPTVRSEALPQKRAGKKTSTSMRR